MEPLQNTARKLGRSGIIAKAPSHMGNGGSSLMQLASATGAAATPAAGGSLIGALLPFAILLGVMYFMVIRPQKTQQKKRDEMLANLRKGNRIVTIGGLYGEIIDIKEDALLVNVAQAGDRFVARFAKWAIQDVIGKDNQPKEKDQPEA